MDISAQAAVAVDVPPAPTRIDWIREPQALDKWLDRAPGKPLAL
ncbi:MAG TPA: ribonuclease D, partial [Marinobacter adhaerens]|nr:ribonuclease D [Marinobacter adhaerens]HCA11970.1 ribonuclease D [Marinobacter adhaerens]